MFLSILLNFYFSNLRAETLLLYASGVTQRRRRILIAEQINMGQYTYSYGTGF